MSLNPFVFRAALLQCLCIFLIYFNRLHGVFWTFASLLGLLFQMISPQAEYCFFADVYPLSGMECGQEGGQVAAECPATDDAAEFHGLLLACRAPCPILPFQVFFVVDRSRLFVKLAVVPFRGLATVEFDH